MSGNPRRKAHVMEIGHMLAENENLSLTTLMEVADIGKRQAARWIRQWLDDGRIVKVGTVKRGRREGRSARRFGMKHG